MNDISKNLKDILLEFSLPEKLLQEELKTIQERRLRSAQNSTQLEFDTLEDAVGSKENALKRNKALRRDLHISISKLRSKKCYNPAEDNLNKMIEKYSEILSREDID